MICVERFLLKNGWLVISKTEREHQPNESRPKIDKVNKKIILPEKQKQDNKPIVLTYENHLYVIIGPSNVGTTYYMLEILEKIGNKGPIHVLTRSFNQNPNYKTSIDIKPIDKPKSQL